MPRYVKSLPPLLFLAVLLVEPANAWDDWQFPEATVRLRLARERKIRRQFTLRADVPESMNDYRVVGATIAGQQTLVASPCRLSGKLVAVEISLPQGAGRGANYAGLRGSGKFPDRSPVLLYLAPPTAGGKEPSPLAANSRTPFALYAEHEKSITRPMTVENLEVYWPRRGLPPFIMELAPAGPVPNHVLTPRYVRTVNGTKRAIGSETMLVRLRLSTNLLLPEATTCSFGAQAGNTAWFVFVDGRGLGSWTENTEEATNTLMTQPVVLEPGLHELDFLILARSYETLPKLVWKREDGPPQPIPTEIAVSPHGPIAVRCEFQEGKTHPGAGFEAATYALPRLGKEYHTVRTVDISRRDGADAAKIEFALSGQTYSGADMRVSAGPYPRWLRIVCDKPKAEIPLAVPCFPRRPVSIVSPEVFVSRLPLTTAAAETVTIEVEVNDLPAQLRGDGSLRPVIKAELLGEGGKSLAVHEEGLVLPAAPATMSFGVGQHLRGIRLSCSLADFRLTPWHDVHVLRPSDDLTGLTPAGDRLVLNGGSVILCIAGEAPETPIDLERPRRVPEGAKLVWVDTFVAPGLVPGDSSDSFAALVGDSKWSVTRLGPDSLYGDPMLPELWKYALGVRALSAQPDAIVWGLGIHDLAAGAKREEVFRRALFLVQASLVRGITPVIVTPPPDRDVPREEARATALALKRLALRIGIPVCDVYSAAHALEARSDQPTFGEMGVADAAAVSLRGMNEQGRKWLAALIADTLAGNDRR